MALRGTNQEMGRPFNRRTVLEFVRRYGPVERSEISDRTGLTVQTISTIVRELEEDGFLLQSRSAPKGRGVPPSQISLNPNGGYAFGIQITPFGLEVALVNLSGGVVASVREKTDHSSPAQAFGTIATIVRTMKRAHSGYRFLGVGLALPGPFGVDSMSFVGPTTLHGWQNVNILERLQQATRLPAFIEIDMAAAALGEQLYGLGPHLSDYYYLFFGVGLGGTMVHDGESVRGNWGNAGEIGHLTVVPNGHACACGNQGCLENYVSLDALHRSQMEEEPWVDSIWPIFARAIRMIENMYDPQTVVLGGFAPRSLLARLADGSESLGNSVAARHDRSVPRLMVASLGEDSVLRGAAALAVRGALDPLDGRMFRHSQAKAISERKAHGPTPVGA